MIGDQTVTRIPKSLHGVVMVWMTAWVFLSSGLESGGATADHAASPVIAQFTAARERDNRWLTEYEVSLTNEHGFAKGADHVGTTFTKYVHMRDVDHVDIGMYGAQFKVRTIVNGWYLQYTIPPKGHHADVAVFDLEGAANHWRAIGGAGVGLGVFEGYFAQNTIGIADVLRSAHMITEVPEKVDGHACIRLDATTTDYGTYHIWFDPSAAYYPRKITAEKGPHDHYNERRMEDIQRAKPLGSDSVVQYINFTDELDQVVIDETSGKPFPKSWRVRRVSRFSDGNSTVMTILVRRTKLDFNPDFKALGAFQPDLNEGAQLLSNKTREPVAEWRNGGPVPKMKAGAQ